MRRLQTVLSVLVACAIIAGVFLTGRANARQAFVGERVAPYAFPMSWGSVKGVTAFSTGYLYFLEGPDGTIRNVRIGSSGIESVDAITRFGTGLGIGAPGGFGQGFGPGIVPPTNLGAPIGGGTPRPPTPLR